MSNLGIQSLEKGAIDYAVQQEYMIGRNGLEDYKYLFQGNYNHLLSIGWKYKIQWLDSI